MEHVAAGVVVEPRPHDRRLVRPDAHRVLEAGVTRLGLAPVDAADLEVGAVQMHRVHALEEVYERPQLRRAEPWPAIDPVLVEGAAADLPLRVPETLERQRPRSRRVDRRQLLLLGQDARHARLLGTAAYDVEAHDRARRRLALGVVEDHLRAGAELAEVD